MRRYILILLFPFSAFSQNLLPNGGFEEVNSCTEFKMPCGPKGWFGIPIGSAYYEKQLVFEGRSALQYVAYDYNKGGKRTFVETEILTPLRKDSHYVVELLYFGYCIDPGFLSVYMPGEDFLFDKNYYDVKKPAVSYTSPDQMEKSKKKSWQKISLPFKATGKERFFVIGNFGSRDNILCQDTEDQVVYIIDNVSLSPLYFKEDIGPVSKSRQTALYNRTERHELLQDYVLAQKPVKKQVPRIDTLIIPDVLFDVNDATMHQKARSLADDFLKGIDLSKLDSIVVEGHTDASGSASANQVLSSKRAATVATHILSRVPAIVIPRGYGSTRPVADNKTEKGRQKNRRVVIYVYFKS